MDTRTANRRAASARAADSGQPCSTSASTLGEVKIQFYVDNVGLGVGGSGFMSGSLACGEHFPTAAAN